MIDITQELFGCNIYPGDPKPTFTRVRQMPGDPYNLTELSMCVHNGTHIDAPRHFIDGGATVDELPLSLFYGTCTVASGLPMSHASIAPLERLLLKGNFDISAAFARLCAESGLRLLGVESQSVGSSDVQAEVHRILLGAGCVLLEGLDLSQVQPGTYTLAAFPLKLGGSDGSPVRAVLICPDRTSP